MNHIVERLLRYGEFDVVVFGDDTILNKPVDEWPACDCLLCWHSGEAGGAGRCTLRANLLHLIAAPAPPAGCPAALPWHAILVSFFVNKIEKSRPHLPCRRLPAEEGAAVRGAAQAVPGQRRDGAGHAAGPPPRVPHAHGAPAGATARGWLKCRLARPDVALDMEILCRWGYASENSAFLCGP